MKKTLVLTKKPKKTLILTKKEENYKRIPRSRVAMK